MMRYTVKNIVSGATFSTDDEGIAIIKSKKQWSNFEIVSSENVSSAGAQYIPDVVRRMREEKLNPSKGTDTEDTDQITNQMSIPEVDKQKVTTSQKKAKPAPADKKAD